MNPPPFKPGDIVEWVSHHAPPAVSFGGTVTPGVFIRPGARFKVLAYGVGSALGDMEYRRDSLFVEDPRTSQFALELGASGFVVVTNPDNLKHECPICHFCCAQDSTYDIHCREHDSKHLCVVCFSRLVVDETMVAPEGKAYYVCQDNDCRDDRSYLEDAP